MFRYTRRKGVGGSACLLMSTNLKDRLLYQNHINHKTFCNMLWGSTWINIKTRSIPIADYSFDAHIKRKRQISYTIRCIDNKIALNKRINAELETMAKTSSNDYCSYSLISPTKRQALPHSGAQWDERAA